MNQVILSAAFQRQLKRLVRKNPKVKGKVGKTLEHLATDINHHRLKLHKLTKLTGENNWSVSAAHKLRIVIHREGDQIFCLRIRSHDQV